ncbi:DUF2634 domain-containing protein [Paenibacillus silviterrae]|nr:DUF2634 domain-containing protein [Paenibacillus chinjuensis]
MQSIKLVNGDLVIENNDLTLVEGIEELAQCCEIVLGTNRGEWFLNPQMGIRFDKLHGKQVSVEAAREEIRSGLRQEPRIQTVESIDVTLNTTARESSIAFTATSTEGEVINSGTG